MLTIFQGTTSKYDFAWSFMSTKLMIMIFSTQRLHKPRLSKLRSGRLTNLGRLFFYHKQWMLMVQYVQNLCVLLENNKYKACLKTLVI